MEIVGEEGSRFILPHCLAQEMTESQISRAIIVEPKHSQRDFLRAIISSGIATPEVGQDLPDSNAHHPTIGAISDCLGHSRSSQRG